MFHMQWVLYWCYDQIWHWISGNITNKCKHTNGSSSDSWYQSYGLISRAPWGPVTVKGDLCLILFTKLRQHSGCEWVQFVNSEVIFKLNCLLCLSMIIMTRTRIRVFPILCWISRIQLESGKHNCRLLKAFLNLIAVV